VARDKIRAEAGVFSEMPETDESIAIIVYASSSTAVALAGIIIRQLLIARHWTMNNVGLREETRVHYTTALRPKYSQQPIVRRKHLDPTAEAGYLHDPSLRQPSQPRTDPNGSWDSDGHHPLTLDQAGFPDTSGVTRPHLSRTLGRILKDCHDSPGLQADELSFCEEEAEVIVHQVWTFQCAEPGVTADLPFSPVLRSQQQILSQVYPLNMELPSQTFEEQITCGQAILSTFAKCSTFLSTSHPEPATSFEI